MFVDALPSLPLVRDTPHDGPPSLRHQVVYGSCPVTFPVRVETTTEIQQRDHMFGTRVVAKVIDATDQVLQLFVPTTEEMLTDCATIAVMSRANELCLQLQQEHLSLVLAAQALRDIERVGVTASTSPPPTTWLGKTLQKMWKNFTTPFERITHASPSGEWYTMQAPLGSRLPWFDSIEAVMHDIRYVPIVYRVTRLVIWAIVLGMYQPFIVALERPMMPHYGALVVVGNSLGAIYLIRSLLHDRWGRFFQKLGRSALLGMILYWLMTLMGAAFGVEVVHELARGWIAVQGMFHP